MNTKKKMQLISNTVFVITHPWWSQNTMMSISHDSSLTREKKIKISLKLELLNDYLMKFLVYILYLPVDWDMNTVIKCGSNHLQIFIDPSKR